MSTWETSSLWSVRVTVISPVQDLADLWARLPDHMSHEYLEAVSGWGLQDEVDALYAYAVLLVVAPDEEEALQLSTRLVDEVIAKAPAAVAAAPGLQHDFAVECAPADDDDGDTPSGPEDFESSLEAVSWQRSAPTADGTRPRILWFTGVSPLERVDVEEEPDKVTIGLFERVPPRFSPEGHPFGLPFTQRLRCVEVPLSKALDGRDLYDGATGKRPSDIVPGRYGERQYRRDALTIDMDSWPCQPRPSGKPIPWDQLA